VINVAGHRLGTREIEETVSSHPAVAEVATVGARDELKGQSVHCFIVLKKPADFASGESEAALKREIESTVARNLGTFARPAAIYIVRALPKDAVGQDSSARHSGRRRNARYRRPQHLGRPGGAGRESRSCLK